MVTAASGLRMILCGFSILLPGAGGAAPHPIHTTYTEISQTTDGRPARLVVRGFLDDLTAAARRRQPRGPVDSVVGSYLVARIRVEDRRGQPVTWKVLDTRDDGEVFWLTLESTRGVSLSGGRVLSAALTEMHADQVNLVRVRLGSRATTLLFSRGDGFRRLEG